MFSRKTTPPKSKVERRVEKIATPDLSLWAEQTLNSLGRQLLAWQRHADPSALDEAEMSAEALYAVVREIRARSQI